MERDPHLGTGVYDPEVYWSARARASGESALAGVCVFGVSDEQNRCADRVQHRALTRAFRAIDLRGRRVLEYGCGVGRWAPRVMALGAEWHGVDLSREMCDQARRRHPQADVRKLEADRIPHEDGTFDLVYAVTVLHHNSHPDQERIVDEMVRVLAPGGHLVLLEDLGETGRSFNMFPRTLAGWRELVERRGFECTATAGLRYWIVRGALASWRRRARDHEDREVTPQSGADVRAPQQGFVHRLVDRIDATLDPWIQWLVPDRAQAAAVMTFRRCS